jgi:hypothetical protein
MAAQWTLGTPPRKRGATATVEVTDGNRFARARFWPTAADAPSNHGWFLENGDSLGWRPTHWRQCEQSGFAELVELDR